MYKDVLRTIADVELFPIIGITLFMGVFMLISIYAFKLSKSQVKELGELPFEEDDQ